MTYGHESWTYDPLSSASFNDLYRNTIFITDDWRVNTDEVYERAGFLPTNDTLLHELGHILARQDEHNKDSEKNVMHENPALANDQFNEFQKKLILKSNLLRNSPE